MALIRHSKSNLQNFGLHVLAIIFMIIFLMPVIWCFLISIRPREFIEGFPPVFWASPTFEHYLNLFISYPFFNYLVNSATAVGSATLLSVILGTLTGYGLARFHFGGKNLLFWILSLRMLPPTAVIVPLYIFFSKVGLLHTKLGLIMAYTLLTLPLSIWLMRSFFLSVPKEVEDAARIDGCSVIQVLLRISLPMATGGIMVTTVFCLLFAWTDYIFALILTTSRNHTITVGISRLITIDTINWGMLLAGAFIAAVPILILMITAQKYILRGMSFGFYR